MAFPLITLICIGLTLTNLGETYKEIYNPQKYTVRHTQRELFNFTHNVKNDSGYMIRSNDRNFDRLSSYLPDFNMSTNTYHVCEKQVKKPTFCEMPAFDRHEVLIGTHFLPAPKPRFRKNKLQLIVKNVSTNVYKKLITFDLKIKGPPYFYVKFTPIGNSNFVGFMDSNLKSRNDSNMNYIRIISNTKKPEEEFSLYFYVSV